jgi:hypothetical protein
MLTVARESPWEELPRLLGELEEIRCTAMVRLTTLAPIRAAESDQLLGTEEAARRLGVSKDYLYHHHEGFAFTRRVGRKLLFSSLGIESYIRQHDSLTAKRQSHKITPSQ